MATIFSAPFKASINLQSPPTPPRTPKSVSDDIYEEARVTFDKTIAGHYRYNATGYKRVGALFLTWKNDDLQCKQSEVDQLREVFATQFHFETDSFEIPEERWQTSLHCKIAQFCWEYDSPDCLTIVYYGGHGYIGTSTNGLKFAAKSGPDGDGDPTVFFNDIQTCLRLPSCDQLLIVDCCNAAKAFAREEIGKRKFELLTSVGAHDKVASPNHPGSFTRCLNSVLSDLLNARPEGFCTSQLYRELYHAITLKEPLKDSREPFLFDQSRHSYGKIWLRPQIPRPRAISMKVEGDCFLKLTLRLNKDPSSIVMNEIAQSLQFLPNVDQVRFEGLYAPKRQIEDFMKALIQAQKIRPLVRKMIARMRLKHVRNLPVRDDGADYSKKFLQLLVEQKDTSLYDWTSAKSDGKTERHITPAPQQQTWPAAENEHVIRTKHFNNSLFSGDISLEVPCTCRNTWLSRTFLWKGSHCSKHSLINRLDLGLGLHPNATVHESHGVVDKHSESSVRRRWEMMYRDETWDIMIWIGFLSGWMWFVFISQNIG